MDNPTDTQTDKPTEEVTESTFDKRTPQKDTNMVSSDIPDSELESAQQKPMDAPTESGTKSGLDTSPVNTNTLQEPTQTTEEAPQEKQINTFDTEKDKSAEKAESKQDTEQPSTSATNKIDSQPAYQPRTNSYFGKTYDPSRNKYSSNYSNGSRASRSMGHGYGLGGGPFTSSYLGADSYKHNSKKYLFSDPNYDLKGTGSDSDKQYFSPRFQFENPESSKRSKSKDSAPNSYFRDYSFPNDKYGVGAGGTFSGTLPSAAGPGLAGGGLSRDRSGDGSFLRDFGISRDSGYRKEYSHRLDASNSYVRGGFEKERDASASGRYHHGSGGSYGGDTFDKRSNNIESNILSVSRSSFFGAGGTGGADRHAGDRGLGSGVSSVSSSVKKRRSGQKFYGSGTKLDRSGDILDIQDHSYRAGSYHEAGSRSKPKRDFGEMLDTIHLERIKNDRLEEKIRSKETLMKQMQEFQDELYRDYMNVKNELDSIKLEKENMYHDYSQNVSQQELLKSKIEQVEEHNQTLQEQNHELKQTALNQKSLFNNLESENSSIKTELLILNKRYDAKVEALNQRVRKLEQEKQDLFEEKLATEEKLENMLRDRGEKDFYKKNAEDYNIQIKSLQARNDELLQRVDTLRRLNQDKEISYQQKIEEAINDNRRILEEKVAHIEKDIMEQAEQKIKKYKAKMNSIKTENDTLKYELQSKPNFRRFRTRSQDETSPDHVMEQNEIYRSAEVNLAKKILKDIIRLLGVKNPSDAVPKLEDVMRSYKPNVKFIDKLKRLVADCSPPSTYAAGPPSLKQTWGWIKNLMEDYMKMKKAGIKPDPNKSVNMGYVEADREIQRVVMEHLRVEERTDIIAKLKKLIYEHSTMSSIVKKIKRLFGIEWVHTLNEVDRRVDQELMNQNDSGVGANQTFDSAKQAGYYASLSRRQIDPNGSLETTQNQID